MLESTYVYNLCMAEHKFSYFPHLTPFHNILTNSKCLALEKEFKSVIVKSRIFQPYIEYSASNYPIKFMHFIYKSSTLTSYCMSGKQSITEQSI